IQFVCIRDGRESYRSPTADHITIHPGSSMFRTSPLYIVAGEIARTSRMFAMSVSPLTRNLIHKVDPKLEDKLSKMRDKKGRLLKDWPEERSKDRKDKGGRKADGRDQGKSSDGRKAPETVSSDGLFFGGQQFVMEKIKGRRTAILPLSNLQMALHAEKDESALKAVKSLRGTIVTRGGYQLMPLEKMEVILTAAKTLNLNPLEEGSWQRKLNVDVREEENMKKLVGTLDCIMRVAVAKESSKALGFITLYTNGNGSYWYKVSKGFMGAVNENLASLEKLVDDANSSPLNKAEKEKISMIYRLVNSLYEAL
ncbi:MAG: ATP-dependent RNA helicase, partial [Treponema sp.]|nr:ATP-dependent RNA helicase [Treponema sp.]